MRGKADLAGDPQSSCLGLDPAFEGNAAIGAERLHAIQPFQKIEVPHGAAEFAVRGTAEARRGLLGDGVFDRPVFDAAEFIRRDLARFAASPSFLERSGA